MVQKKAPKACKILELTTMGREENTRGLLQREGKTINQCEDI